MRKRLNILWHPRFSGVGPNGPVNFVVNDANNSGLFGRILAFLGAKGALYAGALMARTNRHYNRQHIWHTRLNMLHPDRMGAGFNRANL